MARLALALLVVAAVGLAALCYASASTCTAPPQDVTRLKLARARQALLVFEAKHGRFPTDEEGVELLVEEGLLADAEDEWGHLLNYSSGAGRFELWSGGADGRPGGEADDADIFLDG